MTTVTEREDAVDRFRRLLSSHIGFLKRSCWLFDQGHEDEALRIATSLRVLFHDTRHATSLLTHLGMNGPEALMLGTEHNRHGPDWWMDFFVVHLDLNGPEPVRVSAACAQRYTGRPIADWWSGETLFSYDGTGYTRRAVVRAMTDQDGGAHVDAVLAGFYESLMRHGEGLSIVAEFERLGATPFENGVPQYAGNAHLALMRQLAHEVLATVSYFEWPVQDSPIVPWTTRFPTKANATMTRNVDE
ncbi:hypothetical protein [Gordonia aichiensis]|uniref:hypothetical protein n=1 Tax=Gordonia aichiensis TaxID=36820 RepID=UPI00034A115F|nr:hypothetical protein [Gordonia aichiensis]